MRRQVTISDRNKRAGNQTGCESPHYLIAGVSEAQGRTLITFDKKLLKELEG